MATKFTAQIKNFADLTTQNLKYIAVESIQDVMEAAQTPQPSVKRTGGSFEVGKMPVDTAELINSLTVGGATGRDSYILALGNYALGDFMRFAWTAPHSLPIELGTSKMAGRHMVGFNAAKFSEHVNRHAAEVRK